MGIRILADGKLEYTAEDNEGLDQIAQHGNITLVNALSREELFAVQVAAKYNPYPLGGGEAYYRQVLVFVKTHAHLMPKGKSIGMHRELLVKLAGGSFNGPYDSYLQIAHDIAVGADAIHRY